MSGSLKDEFLAYLDEQRLLPLPPPGTDGSPKAHLEELVGRFLAERGKPKEPRVKRTSRSPSDGTWLF